MSWLRRLVLLAVGTLVGLVVCEGVARLLWQAPWYESLLSAQRQSETHSYTRNRWNLRDEEYDEPRPEGRARILMLGDSFTFGQGVYDDRAIFPALLEDALSARPEFAGGVDILNGGLPGSLTDEWLRVFEATADAFDPDVLVIVFFLRDGTRTASVPEFFDRIRSEISARNQRSRAYRYSYLYRLYRDGLDREQVARHYTERFRAAYFGPEHQTAEWRRAQQNLITLRDRALARGMQVGFVVFPVLVELDADYPFADISRLIERFAVEQGFPTYNLLPDFLGRDAPDYWVSAFDQHPNARGHALVAEQLEPFLSELLRAHARSPES